MARSPTAIVSSNLTKTVLVTNYFYRVRAEAARLLVSVSSPAVRVLPIELRLPHPHMLQCATAALKDIGLIHLFKLFTRYCYKPSTVTDPFRSKLVPRPNDFSDFAEYFVRKVSHISFSAPSGPRLSIAA